MKPGKTILYIILAIFYILAMFAVVCGCRYYFGQEETVPTTVPTETTVTTQPPTTETTEPPIVWEAGFISSVDLSAQLTDENGQPLTTLLRGSQLEYTVTDQGETQILWDGNIGYLAEGASVVSDAALAIPAHTLYVRTAVNLRDVNGKLLNAFADKGTAVTVIGFDYLQEDGSAHMYRVTFGENEGYMMPWYLVNNEAEALANYDGGSYAIHAGREDRYGGGGAANLDYFPRNKNAIEGNVMPTECRTLYIAAWRVDEVDAYLAIAAGSGINAFVVDIVDGGSVGYAGEVMKQYCPTAVSAANNTVEEYQAAIRKIKDAGYYVIGRITTFNDTYFIKDHPEYAICDTGGNPLKLSGEYWPTPFSRTAWQYKVDLAVEAVHLMGFHEIQFDYVRFPDSTWRYEDQGTIDFQNAYSETKAQAIQRFLMYATDILHGQGVYVSADVFGECAFNYVTAYGQYWPAISNVVDAISGMPYPDHFGASGSYRPWEHPYDTLLNWGKSAMSRQSETATPAVIRTWIQAYNAIREPYNKYGAEEIAAQIKGLRDAGCTGGFMTWNGGSSLDKYRELIPAFAPPEKPEA